MSFDGAPYIVGARTHGDEVPHELRAWLELEVRDLSFEFRRRFPREYNDGVHGPRKVKSGEVVGYVGRIVHRKRVELSLREF